MRDIIPGDDIREGDEVEVRITHEPNVWSWERGVVVRRNRGLGPVAEYGWTVKISNGKVGFFYIRSIRKVTE